MQLELREAVFVGAGLPQWPDTIVFHDNCLVRAPCITVQTRPYLAVGVNSNEA